MGPGPGVQCHHLDKSRSPHCLQALAAHNCAAWGRDQAYDAWVARWGPPEEAAGRLLRDPARALGPLLPYLQLPGGCFLLYYYHHLVQYIQ